MEPDTLVGGHLDSRLGRGIFGIISFYRPMVCPRGLWFFRMFLYKVFYVSLEVALDTLINQTTSLAFAVRRTFVKIGATGAYHYSVAILAQKH